MSDNVTETMSMEMDLFVKYEDPNTGSSRCVALKKWVADGWWQWKELEREGHSLPAGTVMADLFDNLDEAATMLTLFITLS